MNTIKGFYVLVSRAFGKYNAAHLVTFFQNVISMMTDNPAFTNIDPPLAEGQLALADLKAKDEAAMNGGRMQIAERNEAQNAFLVIARQWANGVESSCNGSLATLLSSGFEAKRAPKPPAPPEVPTGLGVGYWMETSGLLRVFFKGSRNNRTYLVQYAESVDGPWTDCPLDSRTRINVIGLTPGKTYYFRVKAIGVNGMSSGWTATTSRMAT